MNLELNLNQVITIFYDVECSRHLGGPPCLNFNHNILQVEIQPIKNSYIMEEIIPLLSVSGSQHVHIC